MSIKPYLRLLQTPVVKSAEKLSPPGAPATTAHFDRSRPAPHTEALRAAWCDGHGRGLQRGYIQGLRYGVLCGMCTTVALATLLLCVAAGLGWL